MKIGRRQICYKNDRNGVTYHMKLIPEEDLGTNTARLIIVLLSGK